MNSALHISGVIGDYFALENHTLSTRSADGYKATDKDAQKPVLLWMLRHPLAINSNAVQRFHQRMAALSAIEPPVCQILKYGVDSNGVAFAVLPPISGQAITAGNLDPLEAERRFLAAIRALDRVHRSGIVCGDLCGSSFWVDRGGDVRFIGVMGSFDSEAVQTAMLPPLDTLHFAAPEQRAGGGVEPASDVFALGVMGYNLLTQHFPFEKSIGALQMGTPLDIDQIPTVKSLCGNPPVWADEVLMRCLQPNSSARYSNVPALLAAVNQARERSMSEQSAPARVGEHQQGQRLPKSNQAEGRAVQIRTGAGRAALKPAEEEVPNALSVDKIKVAVAATAVLAVVLLIMIVRPWGGGGSQTTASNSENGENVTPVAAQPATTIAPEVATEKRAAFKKLADSDDPVSYDQLVRGAVRAESEEERHLAEEAVLDRARRLQNFRAAEQVEAWLKSRGNGPLPAVYEPILRSLDSTLPLDARSGFLRQAYTLAPRVVIKLAAAAAFDSKNLADFQPVLSQIIGDALKLEGASDRSALALIIAHGELAHDFGDLVVQRKDEIPGPDLLWMLTILTERDDVNVRAVAGAIIDRGVVSKLKNVLLAIVRDRGDLPKAVLIALVNGVTDKLSAADVAAFGAWLDVDSERALLALCGDVKDNEMLLRIFDNAAGKSLSTEPASSLVKWIRSGYWERRAELAHLVGVLGSIGSVSEEDIKKSLDVLDNFAKDENLIDILLSANNPMISRAVLERFPKLIKLRAMLNLLGNSDRQVRLLAIEQLKGTNDLGVMKLIIDSYDQERDPELRAKYKENFWFIAQKAD